LCTHAPRDTRPPEEAPLPSGLCRVKAQRPRHAVLRGARGCFGNRSCFRRRERLRLQQVGCRGRLSLRCSRLLLRLRQLAQMPEMRRRVRSCGVAHHGERQRQQQLPSSGMLEARHVCCGKLLNDQPVDVWVGCSRACRCGRVRSRSRSDSSSGGGPNGRGWARPSPAMLLLWRHCCRHCTSTTTPNGTATVLGPFNGTRNTHHTAPDAQLLAKATGLQIAGCSE
jgi:hypothetical protein